MGHANAPLTPEGRRRLVERIDEGRPISHVADVERFNLTMKTEWLYVRAYSSEEDRRNHLVPFLNEYNHDREHTSIGNRPPMSRAPTPGPKLTLEPIVLPTDRAGQMSLDLTGDNNVPREQ